MQGTLLDFLARDDGYPYALKSSLMANLIFGLKILHATNIILRDIKLENILIFKKVSDNDNERLFIAKLVDFGSVLLGVDRAAALPTGTRPWNAPEWRSLSMQTVSRRRTYTRLVCCRGGYLRTGNILSAVSNLILLQLRSGFVEKMR